MVCNELGLVGPEAQGEVGASQRTWRDRQGKSGFLQRKSGFLQGKGGFSQENGNGGFQVTWNLGWAQLGIHEQVGSSNFHLSDSLI